MTIPETPKLTIFISVEGKTEKFGRSLKSALEKKGHRVFHYKENITAGDDWFDTVFNQALEQSDRMIVLMTPAYFKSAFCVREYHSAKQKIGTKPKLIFPVMLEKTALTSEQSVTQFCDVTAEFSSKQTRRAINKIINELERSLNPNIFAETAKRAKKTITTLLDRLGRTVSLFKKDEHGIVIAKFVQRSSADYDVATEWINEMESKFADVAKNNNIRFALSDETITTENEALALLRKTKATVVIWGDISGKIRDGLGDIPARIFVNYTVSQKSEISELLGFLLKDNIWVSASDYPDEQHQNEISLSSFSVYLRKSGDLDYLVYCLLGLLSRDVEQAILFFTSAIEKLKRTDTPAQELFLGLAFTLRAWCYFKVQHYEEAMNDAKVSLLSYDVSGEFPYVIVIVSYLILESLAVKKIRDGYKDYSEFYLPWLEGYLEKYNYSPIANFLFGLVLADNNQFAEAIEVFEKALRFNPALSIAAYQMAANYALLAYMNDDDVEYYEDSLRASSYILNSNPLNAFAHFSLAKALIRLGKNEEALTSLHLAIQLNPKSFSDAFVTNQQSGHDFEAELVNYLLDQLFPKENLLNWAYLERGKLFHNLELYAQAISDFEKVGGKDFLTAQICLGTAMSRLGNLEKAIEHYSLVIDSPDVDNYHLGAAFRERAWAYHLLGDNSAALHNLRAASNFDALDDIDQEFLEQLESELD